jgi:hypothetical protein
MRSKLFSTLCLLPLASLLLSARAPAQTNWGSALSLDGVDDHVVFPSGVWFSNQFTIELWVYERSYANYVRILDFGNRTNRDSVLVCQESSTGRPALHIFHGTGADTSLAAPQPLPLNRWVHLAVTFSNNVGVICMNGVPVATSTSMTQPNPVIRTNAYLGRSNSPADPYAMAIFDELRIWNVARTAGQIQDHMLQPLSGGESNLVACYHFDEGSGAAAHDATPKHEDGTLVNGPAWTSSEVHTNPAFVEIWAGLPGVHLSSVAWGDYDDNGWLDLLLTGFDELDSICYGGTWRNANGALSQTYSGLPKVTFGSAAWGDYDNDGWLDVLLTGDPCGGPTSQVWRRTESA